MGRERDVMNVAFCEVAVDTETGEVEILKFGVVADPGKVIRPISLESQIDQVMYFSQGCQLLEEYVYDKRTGVKLSANMFDHRKPTMLDVAPVEREFLETRAGNAAYGASGISHSLANTHLVIIAILTQSGFGWIRRQHRKRFSKRWERHRRGKMKPFNHMNAKSLEEAVSALAAVIAMLSAAPIFSVR